MRDEPITACADDESELMAGLPVQRCAAPEVVEYTLPIFGQWNNPDTGAPLPLLVIGSLLADINPDPPPPLQAELSLFVPAGEPPVAPTYADIPNEYAGWIVPQPMGPTGEFVGLLLPLELVPLEPGTPFWMRVRTLDADGCEWVVYGLFPNGLPEDSTSDVDFWIIDALSAELHTVEGAADDETPGAQTEFEYVVTPNCPTQGTPGVAVTPACGAMPVTGPSGGPVQVEGDIAVELGVEPVDCGGTPSLPVSIQCQAGPVEVTQAGPVEVTQTAPFEVVVPDGVPLAVELDEPIDVAVQGTVPVSVADAPAAMAVQTEQLVAAPGATTNDTIPIGARVVTIRMYAGQDASILAGTMLQIGGAGGVTLAPSDPPLVLEAPAGQTFPVIPLALAADGGEGGNVFCNWTAFF